MVTFNEGPNDSSFVDRILIGLRGLEYVDQVRQKGGGGESIIIEWRNHDPDPKFSSSMSVVGERGYLTEMTMRFGPVATYNLLSRTERQDLEGEWIDVVLDAQTAVRPRLDLDARDVDLGDGYISDYARPHVRVRHKAEGYTITPTKIVAFIKEVNQRHKRKFGTLEDRIADPRFADILELR